MVVEWLPRKALCRQPFSHREEGASCRAVRGAEPRQRPVGALQVEGIVGPGRQVTTSLTVASLDWQDVADRVR